MKKYINMIDIGDHVIVNSQDCQGRLKDKTATVVYSSSNSIGLKFDENMNLHDCDGRCEYGHGWWVHPWEVKLIIEE